MGEETAGPVRSGEDPGAIVKAVNVSLVAALWFLARWTYYESYFSTFGVPADLDLTPPVSVMFLVFSAVSTVVYVNWIAHMLRGKPRAKSPVGWALTESYSHLGVGFVLVVLIEGYLGHNAPWAWKIIGGIALLFVAGEWLMPLITQRKIEGYFKKLEAFQRPSTKTTQKPPEDQPWPGFLGELFSWAGATAKTALIGAVIAMVGGHYMGHRNAAQKRNWLEVSQSGIRTTPVDVLWVLLSRTDGKLWVAPATKQGQIGPEIRAVDPQGASLVPVTLTVQLRPPG